MPAPVGARYVRNGIGYTGDLITERLMDVESLAGWLRSRALPILNWIAIGRCIRAFHDLGVCHADLNAHNMMVGEDGVVHLIDFDRGSLRKPGLWCDENLVRLRRSLEKIAYGLPPEHFSEADWHGLLDGYQRPGGAPRCRPGRAVVHALSLYLAVYLLAPVFCAVLLWRGLRERGYWRHFSERFGFGRPSFAHQHLGACGLGGRSAGRGRADPQPAGPIPADSRWSSRTLTPDRERRARRAVRRRAGAQRDIVRYVPLDLPGSVRRFFDRVRPRIAVILETELWPNLYHECGAPSACRSCSPARASRRAPSAAIARMAGLFRETLSHGIVIAAQSEDDAERFRSIGANPQRTHVTGNVKFDLTLPPEVAARGRGAARRAMRASAQSGSPAARIAGEEQIVLDAHRRVRMTHSERAARSRPAPSRQRSPK